MNKGFCGTKYHPEPCQWPYSIGGPAWRVPYRRAAHAYRGFDAYINLEVRQCGARCAYPQTVAFVIDTGTDVTIVPRSALDDCAFVRRNRVSWKTIHGLCGGATSGA